MAKLFDTLAGRAQGADYFRIGDAEFYADPLTLEEVAEMRAIPDIERLNEQGQVVVAERDVGAWAEFMAAKLRVRVRGKTPDPATITPDWLIATLPWAWAATLDYLLTYGRMPDTEKK